MQITETDTITFWQTAGGREVTDLSELGPGQLAFGVSLKDGKGFFAVPEVDEVPPRALYPQYYAFIGTKDGKRFIKRWAIDGYEKAVAMERLRRRCEEFGFEAIILFDVQPYWKEAG